MTGKKPEFTKDGWFPVEAQPAHNQKLPDADMLVLRANREALHKLAARKAIRTVIKDADAPSQSQPYPVWAIVQATDTSFYRVPIWDPLTDGVRNNLPGLVEIGLKPEPTVDRSIDRALFAAETPKGIYLPLPQMYTEYAWVVSAGYPDINTWSVFKQPQLDRLPGIKT